MAKKTKEEVLLTLTDVHFELKGTKSGGVSMPSLSKYKKDPRLAAHMRGVGRKAKFTKAALPIFMKLKQEGEAKRGRPRKVQQ